MKKSPFFAVCALLCLSTALVAGEAAKVEKVVYHLDDNKNARWAMDLANAHLSINDKAKIVIVAYSTGVYFLTEEAKDHKGNPFESDVFELQSKGVEFRACARTLEFMKVSAENVLDDVKIVPSGVYEVVRLQSQEGYAYLKP